MGKISKKNEVSNVLCWTSGVTLSQLKSDIEELEKKGVDYIDMSIDTYYDSTSIEIRTYTTREETDSEYNLRIQQQKLNEQRTKDYELKQLEKLKAKYENGK